MDDIIADIIAHLRANPELSAEDLARLMRAHNKGNTRADGTRVFSKKLLMPYYLSVREQAGERWQAWNVTPDIDKRIVALLQVKPRRTQSGVATITVITKPWPCGYNCLYCPTEDGMPKSYLSDEPACQRAVLHRFDPFAQVTARLKALTEMGHPTDKVELIVLGGTFSDYPRDYRVWFVYNLFRALNSDVPNAVVEPDAPGIAAAPVKPAADADVDAAVGSAAEPATPTLADLRRAHTRNETARHRCVGLVFETRPDCLDVAELTFLRALGATKIQMGVQSISDEILRANRRHTSVAQIRDAFALMRLFGFKTHAHFMINLFGMTPERDVADYRTFMTDPAYCPDELKLYPCALIRGADLCANYAQGTWRPYTHEELLDVLTACILATPAHTRVSRMIRDFSAGDIVAGDKTANLRQLVENRARRLNVTIQEMRMREITDANLAPSALRLDEVYYDTLSTQEYFLQMVTDDNRLAGFLRLSLPRAEYLAAHAELCRNVPFSAHDAIIREVHVYGRAAALVGEGNAQHRGFGKRMVERACELAAAHGRDRVAVISAIGTREYYRRLGFELPHEDALYQYRTL